jgi:hypothetical protein
VATSRSWMDMTPKKELRVFTLKCSLCGEEAEILSDEFSRKRKCSSCNEEFDPNKCEVIRIH